jgi:hypothetical protein
MGFDGKSLRISTHPGIMAGGSHNSSKGDNSNLRPRNIEKVDEDSGFSDNVDLIGASPANTVARTIQEKLVGAHGP